MAKGLSGNEKNQGTYFLVRYVPHGGKKINVQHMLELLLRVLLNTKYSFSRNKSTIARMAILGDAGMVLLLEHGGGDVGGGGVGGDDGSVSSCGGAETTAAATTAVATMAAATTVTVAAMTAAVAIVMVALVMLEELPELSS
jgi:hypothetical protein